MTKSRDIANSTSTLDVDGGTIKLDGNYPVGTGNVALGDTALDSISSGSNNTAIGSSALTANTSGDNMTAVGQNAGLSHTTGNSSTFIGTDSGKLTTTGIGNTFVGDGSGRQNTTGASNVAMGQSALLSNTTASDNTAVGFSALTANTTGRINTAVGKNSMLANTTGGDNSAFGGLTLDANTTGNNNTAMGYAALSSSTTASNNTAVGFLAGYSNTTGNDSVYVGRQAGLAVTTGVKNTYVGPGTMGTATTGNYNTVIGGFNGNQNGLDIRTSSNNIVLSDGVGNPWGYRSGADGNWFFDQTNNNEYTLRVRQTGTGANPYGLAVQYNNSAPNNDSGRFITCSDSSAIRLKVFNNGNVQNQNNSYGSLSDEKLKENIVDSGSQWDDIKALTVRKYSLKEDNLDAPNMLGVIAQEVEAAGMSGLVTESVDEDINNNDLGTVTKAVNYSILYMKAVKALQEAMTRIETLETKVTALEG